MDPSSAFRKIAGGEGFCFRGARGRIRGMSVKNAFNAMRLGSALDEHGAGGETCLTRAVKMGLVGAAEDFMKLGADANRENAAGEYPLFIALELKDRAMILALVKGGASVFYKKDGLTFRQQALKQGMPDVAAFADRIEKERIAMIKAMSMGCRM
jgi:hypothetical protein